MVEVKGTNNEAIQTSALFLMKLNVEVGAL